MRKMLEFLFGLLIGFVGAYALDYYLTKRDER
jgi:hypothetical protein